MIARRSFLAGALAAPALLPGQELQAPYVPTPLAIVEKLLRLGELKSGEKMFDLGSGDGRMVILAAKQFGADATGVEIDPELVRESRAQIQKQGLQKRARIIEGDLFEQDFRPADLITLYLLTGMLERLRPLLERQLKPGARVVSHDFEVTGWKPDKVETIEDDGQGRSRTLLLYRR